MSSRTSPECHAEARRRGHHPPSNASPTMPLFGWMKWPRVDDDAASGPCSAPSRVLLRELLWQLEQRECLAREEEPQHRGTVGCPRPPGLRALVPASERRQLERLCARVPPTRTMAVLSRFREVLASNDVLPWELVCVFKQVLRDFLCREEEEVPRCQPPPLPMEAWAGGYQAKQAALALALPEGAEGHREEIPTISSYVDRHLRAVCPHAAHRDWSLPYCQSSPYDCPQAYSTTL